MIIVLIRLSLHNSVHAQMRAKFEMQIIIIAYFLSAVLLAYNSKSKGYFKPIILEHQNSSLKVYACKLLLTILFYR